MDKILQKSISDTLNSAFEKEQTKYEDRAVPFTKFEGSRYMI